MSAADARGGQASDWLDALRALPPLGRDAAAAVIVSVVATRGSAPRPAGTHMVVTRERVDGTIGGGHLEFQAIAIARDLVAGDGRAERLRRFPLGASLGQCCGGVVTLLFEPVGGDTAWIARTSALRDAGVPCVTIAPTRGDAATGRLVVTATDVFGGASTADAPVIERARDVLRAGGIASLVRTAADASAPGAFLDPVLPAEFAIVLFGAGHVGKALVHMLADLDCRITWIDSRIDAFPDAIPANVVARVTDVPEDEVSAARPGSYFLVMTHEHALDERLTEQILRRDDFAYFGLIGSLSKRRQFEQRLARRGMPAARFEAMTCPIGIAGIRGKAPATIAVAVAAQLLQVRETRASARTPYAATAAAKVGQ